jgi:hypothetical protein
MALNITYWTASRNPNMPGGVISSENVTISGTSAQSGATPNNAVYVSLMSDVATRFLYAANPTATTSDAGLAPYERVWLDAVPGNKFAGISG